MAAVAVAFASGILVAGYVPLAGCAVLIASALLAGLIILPPRHRPTLLLVCAITFSGAARYAGDRSIAPDDISRFGRRVGAFEGTVVSDTTGNTDSVRATLRVSRIRLTDGWRDASGKVMVTLYSDRGGGLPRIGYGDRARILVSPYVPSEPTNPGQFSWKAYLARHGIYVCASVRESGQIRMLRRGGRSARGAALAAKRYLVSSIFRVHPSREASVMSGVVLGTYAYLDDDTLRDFTRTGTMHILAASGYNCFVLLMIASPILKLLRVLPRYRGIITVLLIAAYLLMVGPMPSLLRAAVMASLMLLACSLRRVPDYANLFYVAAMVLLIHNPSNFFDVGFQLSFLAVWGLITVAPLIDAIMARTNLSDLHGKPRLRKRTRWLARLALIGWGKVVGVFASTLVGTTAVSLMTAPVVAQQFHYVSLTSLPANLAVAFLVPVVFLDSFASALTVLVPHGAGWIGAVGTYSTRAMLGIVGYFGSLEHSSVAVQSPGALGIVGYYAVLLAAAGYVRSRFARR